MCFVLEIKIDFSKIDMIFGKKGCFCTQGKEQKKRPKKFHSGFGHLLGGLKKVLMKFTKYLIEIIFEII
jgi:hypothetical protein